MASAGNMVRKRMKNKGTKNQDRPHRKKTNRKRAQTQAGRQGPVLTKGGVRWLVGRGIKEETAGVTQRAPAAHTRKSQGLEEGGHKQGRKKVFRGSTPRRIKTANKKTKQRHQNATKEGKGRKQCLCK